MRIRQIKPEFWLDKDIQTRLDAECRLFYIGLWQMADDAGWLVWDVTTIGATLYAYRTPDEREALVVTERSALTGLCRKDPHLIVYRCGHAQVPKIVKHQRFGGRPVYTVRDAHARGCARLRADAHKGRERNGMGRERDGKERNGSASGQSPTNEEARTAPSLRELVALPDDVAERIGIGSTS